MAMVGPLAFHTDDDQGDSDFFDQLADEFGNGDLGHLHKEGKNRLDEAFSKLIVGEEGAANIPASVLLPAPVSIDQIDEDNSAGDDFWMDENLVEETPAESKGDTCADVSTTADSLVEFPQLDAPLATDGFSTDGDIQAERVSSSEATHLKNFGVENAALMIRSENLVSVENNAVLGAISTPAQVANVPGTECEIEGFVSKDVCPPEIGTMESGLGVPDALDSNQSSNGVCMESTKSKSMQNDDFPGATESQQSPSVKELQWSSFDDTYIPNTFGSYSDFFSELGSQTGVGSNPEAVAQIGFYQVESSMEPSLTSPNAHAGLSVGVEGLGMQAAPTFYGTAVDQFDETGFWNQQRVLNYGTSEHANSSPVNVSTGFGESQQAAESEQPGLANSGSEAGLANSGSEAGLGNYPLGATNHVAQPQDEVQQNWESMYPGWYFDYTSNQWRQIEDRGAVEQLQLREEVDFSYSQTTQNGEVVSPISDPTWQANEGQGSWSALGSNESMEGGIQAASNDHQDASDSIPQQQVNWEDQYPGWYYDHHAQQWRQISDDSQPWASYPDNKLEASQVVDSANTSQLPGAGWIDQQVQPHYQSEVNQNIYQPERSQSLYSSSAGINSLNRGMSFNSWAEPAVDIVDVGRQGIDNSRQGSNIGSWTGFQGRDNTVPSQTYQSIPGSTYQSQTDYNLADKSPLFGRSHGFFQPHNFSGGSIEGARSSAGRPLHALVAFGFGGKLVTMKAPQLGTSEPLVLHDLNQLVLNAEKRGQNDGVSYFYALSRQGLSGPLHGAASKDILKWVDERIENCGMEDSQGIRSEGLWVLWGVLKIACLHYGKLRSMAGSTGLKSQTEDGPEVALGRLLAAAKSQSHWNQGLATSLDVLHASPTGHQLQAVADAVRNRLMDGKRNEALQLAQQGQLWGLSLVLAWQLGEKVYADTVLQMAQQQFLPGSPLRTLLLLFAGQTTELFKIQNMSLSAGTPGPFAPAVSNAQDSAGGMLGDWLGNLSIIAANPTKGDEQVITHLGDSLWKDQGEVAGAHTCYLVAESSFEWFSKEARLCLVGADHFKYERTFATPQAIQRTELFEYAKVLGNPQFVLVPFQPFKLLYAHMLAEAGKITEACRYCQLVTKNLKNAGRGLEIEFCKQSAVALEERLRQHSQGGYSLNFSTGKLVGKVMGTIDSTIHKIIGGPPLPPASQTTPAFGSPQDWYPNDSKYGNASALVKAAPLIPSASNSNLFTVNSQVDVPTRSISEPNLIRSSTQEVPNAVISSETSSASPKQLKPAGTGGGYLGRFGSQMFAKAIGLIKHNKEAKLGDENKFYYDEKLKRWVEAGVEQSIEEAPLAPPPIVASFNSSFGTPLADAKSGGEPQGQGSSASLSSSADLPPMPPSVNQFSARGRLHGVRSRYVDTFNKNNTEVAAKPSQSPIVPAGGGGGWGMASSRSQFFASASVSSVTDGSSRMIANGHIDDGSPEFLKSAADHSKGGHLQVEHEPLLPKNLSTSFMDVPVLHKPSSATNLAMLTNNEAATNKSGVYTSGNMARAVSWSGESPSAGTQNFVSSVSSTYATGRLPNGFIADMQMEVSVNSASAVSDTTLPSPPIVETPAPFEGYERSPMQAGIAGKTLSGSLQGATYGEMQEVEL